MLTTQLPRFPRLGKLTTSFVSAFHPVNWEQGKEVLIALLCCMQLTTYCWNDNTFMQSNSCNSVRLE